MHSHVPAEMPAASLFRSLVCRHDVASCWRPAQNRDQHHHQRYYEADEGPAAVLLHTPSSHHHVEETANGSCDRWYANNQDCPLQCIGAQQEYLALVAHVGSGTVAIAVGLLVQCNPVATPQHSRV